jgi:superfamily II DNA or RNA helicase
MIKITDGDKLSFRELNLKPSYDSDEDDILGSFYIPVLSESRTYYRLAGFFSSTALALAARGIAGLIKNDGKMKLVASVILQKDDIEAIQRGLTNPEKVIEGTMLKEMDGIEDELTRNHVEALAYLVANKRLEIKVAVMVGENGVPLNPEESERNIFHQKVGVMEDGNGNTVSFSGSINESLGGWINNIEEFNVFRSWIQGEGEHLDANRRKFENLWAGRTKRARIFDVPDAVSKKFIRMAPKGMDELKLLISPKKGVGRVLRAYQTEAINNWAKNQRKGIFEMATGTGKTIAALGCLKELQRTQKKLITVITCPYTHLVKQWRGELRNFGLGDGMEIYSDTADWKNLFQNAILDVNLGNEDGATILTTHATFSSDSFIDIIKKANCDLFLIADEVHGLGAPERRNGLLENYKYRLGLSATPARWLDDEGTAIIIDYFNNVVFEFSLKRAITEINPDTGMSYLTPYEYHPYFVGLTESELAEYERMTKKIAAQYYKAKSKEERQIAFDLLCIMRQRIVVNAENKLATFKQILDKLGSEVSHCLIYCSPQQISAVQEILSSRNIIQHKFTAHESADERQMLLSTFASGRIQALVAMKCLDEGVDVPVARTAIFLASSGNPKEFIQRRGRILRRAPDKEKAIIYDIIVIPNANNQDYSDIERKILTKELKRYEEFASISKNYGECLVELVKLKDRFNLRWVDINEPKRT